MSDFIIQTKKHSTMLSIWTEELHCHVDEDGVITLQVSKTDKDETEWLPELDGIETPSEFVRAINFLVEEWSGTWTVTEVVKELEEHYPKFGKQVREFINSKEDTNTKRYPKCRASEEEHQKFAKKFKSELVIGLHPKR